MGYHNRIRAAFDSWLRLGRSAYADNEDAFARLLLMGDTYTSRNAILYNSSILDPASTYRTAIGSWQAGSSGMMSGQRMSAVQTFQMQAEAACIGRSFAVTRNGHIALVPPPSEGGRCRSRVLWSDYALCAQAGTAWVSPSRGCLYTWCHVWRGYT